MTSKQRYVFGRTRVTVLAGLLIALLSAVVSAEKVTLTMMVYPDLGWPDFHERAIEEFKAENPGIDVEIVTGLAEKLQITLAGGVNIDVFYSSGTQFAVPARSGLLAPLEPLMARDPSFDLQDYFRSAVDAHRLDGVLYGMPQTVSPAVLVYNRALFDEAGVGYPHDWTWNDLVTEGKKLSRDTSGDGEPDQFAMSYQNYSHYNRWPIWVWSNGGRVFSEDGKRVVLDQPESVEALEFYLNLAKEHRIAPLPNHPIMAGTNYTNLFNNGQAAMIPNTRFYAPPDEMDWDLAHMPYSKVRATSLITNYYGVIAGSQHPDEAWKLVRFLLEKAARHDLLVEAAPAIPSYIPNAQELIEIDGRRLPSQLLWIEATEYARGPYYPPVSNFASIVTQQFNAMANDQISARGAAEQITHLVNVLLEELEASR